MPFATTSSLGQLNRRRTRRDARAGGFSFTEVMFAVIILGVGFIMVAAIFPVAIQQAKTTNEEVTAASIARTASAVLEHAFIDGPTPTNVPGTNTSNCRPASNQLVANRPAIVQQRIYTDVDPTATVAGAAPTLYKAISGNQILSQDPRFGWVCLFRRAGQFNTPASWDPYVQVYVIAVQSRRAVLFDRSIDPPTNLRALPVKISVSNDDPLANGADLIAIGVATPPEAPYLQAAATGAYVVIADDHITSPAADIGRLNGLMFRLGTRRPELDTVGTSVVFELQPGSDFTPDPGANGILGGAAASSSDDISSVGVNGVAPSTVIVSGPADAWLVGRGFDPASNQFEGNAMPIGAFTTFVKVNH